MPRAVQGFRQNATVTHSPATVGSGDPSDGIDGGDSTFKIPSFLDVCNPATQNGQNPFVSGLNTMGDEGGNHTGIAGQTGNILSGFQQFTDALCGFAAGGTSSMEVLEAARNLRRQGVDLHETIVGLRRLRDTVGTGTTPQTVLAGVEAVSGAANSNPLVSDAIAKGQADEGATGNQALDGLNGASGFASTGHKLLTGKLKTDTGINDLLDASGNAINQNTSFHFFHKSSSTAQSVTTTNQNLLVSQDFASSNTVDPDPNLHWSWNGTAGDPATDVLGCLQCVCDGTQDAYISSEIPVSPGETIEVAATVNWTGLTYTGSSPLILGVEKFRQMKTSDGLDTFADIGWTDCATVTSPGSSSSGAWVGIAGTYTGEPGVDQIRLRFNPAHNATAGTVQWDNGEFLKLDLIPDDAVPGVGTTVDNIVTNLYGAAGSGFTHNQAALALANTAANLTSVSATVAALSAEGHTGSIAGDAFNFTGPILSNANWTGFYHNPGFGDYEGNGNGVAWSTATTVPANTDGVLGYFRWQGTDPTSTTDYQLVQVVLDGAMGVNTSRPAYSSIWLFGRMASDLSSWTQLAIGSDGSYGIWYQNGGSPVNMTSGTCPVPAAGSVISFYIGDKNTTRPRHYRIEVGSTVVADFDEVGTSSPLGSSNRGYGWGGAASYWKLVGVHYVTPPPINQWLGMDQ